jgi:hypothetical protein
MKDFVVVCKVVWASHMSGFMWLTAFQKWKSVCLVRNTVNKGRGTQRRGKREGQDEFKSSAKSSTNI